MYCSHCGAKIPDDAAFCQACGNPVSNGNQPSGATGQSADNTQNQYAGRERPYESRGSQFRGQPGSSADVIINMCRSPLTLAFSIVLSACVVLNIFGIFYVSMGNAIITILLIISQIILCVGCWLVYVNSSRNQFNTIGFSVLRVGVPIYIVTQILQILILVFELSYMFSGIARLAEIIAGLAFLAVCVWCLYGFWRVTNDGWKILKGEAVQWTVPLRIIVILIIDIVIEVIFTVLIMTSGAQFAVILQYLISVAVYVLAVVILFRIRREGSLSA